MSAERGNIVLAAIGNTASGHSRRSWECPEAVLPDRALYLLTFSHLLIVNKLLPLSLSSLSHGLEHQTQPPTHVTPVIPVILLLSPLSPVPSPYTPYSLLLSPYQLTPVILYRTPYSAVHLTP
jgi:hypothetical protein